MLDGKARDQGIQILSPGSSLKRSQARSLGPVSSDLPGAKTPCRKSINRTLTRKRKEGRVIFFFFFFPSNTAPKRKRGKRVSDQPRLTRGSAAAPPAARSRAPPSVRSASGPRGHAGLGATGGRLASPARRAASRPVPRALGRRSVAGRGRFPGGGWAREIGLGGRAPGFRSRQTGLPMRALPLLGWAVAKNILQLPLRLPLPNCEVGLTLKDRTL
ncbi:uncharacterized protein LOC125083743 [Lutra lutra]|uniref:uncharacterized protein LOC125083743 n=1 Tax=Lutra lutra TaxID=9657 RepID=UPI001FD055D7|nr:uncharacterized protein LOC125083743 [Lutra lutra]